MYSLKRYGTETEYNNALANKQFVNNQITLTDDDGYVHFLFQNYQFNVTVDDENDGADLIIEDDDGVRMFTQNDTTLAEFTDTEFDVLKYGDKRPTFTIARNNSVGNITDIQYYQYYDTDWKRRFWDYDFCVEEFFNYTNLSNSTQPLKFIVDEGYTELLEVTTSNNKVYTFFRKPTAGGNHTKIIMFFASIEDMWKLMVVCPTDNSTNSVYSAIAAAGVTPSNSNGFTGSDLANISESVFEGMTGRFKNATDFKVFRFFERVTTIPSGSRSSSFFRNSPITHIVFPKTLTIIGDYAFNYAQSLTEIKLPNSLKSLGSYAFFNCTDISGEVVVPYGVRTIRGSAFRYCSSITRIVIKGATIIQTYSFENCTSLQEVVLPHMLTQIMTSAFRGCSALVSIKCFATSAPSVGTQTFKNVGSNGVLYTPTDSDYRTWLGTGNYYLGKYNWTQADLTERGMWEI